MTISATHPHDARMTELKLLGTLIFLGVCVISLILFFGTGGHTHSDIPGVSAWDLFRWNLPKIAPLAIPCAITVAVGVSAMFTNSSFYEAQFSATGYSPGETAFTVIGTWFGFGLAMVSYPKWDMYTVQEQVCMLSGLMTVGFGAVAIISRRVR